MVRVRSQTGCYEELKNNETVDIVRTTHAKDEEITTAKTV